MSIRKTITLFLALLFVFPVVVLADGIEGDESPPTPLPWFTPEPDISYNTFEPEASYPGGIYYSPPIPGNSIQYRQYAWYRVNGTPKSYFYISPKGSVGSTKPIYQTISTNSSKDEVIYITGSALMESNSGVPLSRESGYIFEFVASYRNGIVNSGEVLGWFFKLPSIEFCYSDDFFYKSIFIDATVILTYENFSTESKSVSVSFEELQNGKYYFLEAPYHSDGGRITKNELVINIHPDRTDVISEPSKKVDFYMLSNDIGVIDAVAPRENQKTLLAGLSKLLNDAFVPNSDELIEYLNDLNDSASGSDFSSLTIDAIQQILSTTQGVFKLKLPTLYITVNGQKHVFFEGQTVTPFTNSAAVNIFEYVKDVMTIVISIFMIWKLKDHIQRFFGRRYSDI